MSDGSTDGTGLGEASPYRWYYGEQMAAVSDEEIVGIGFKSDAVIGGVYWYQLTNIAPAQNRDKTFEIDGAELRAVIARAQRSGAHDVLCIWHSHRLSIEPSDSDLEFFPGWLTDKAVVWHVPTATSSVYDESGVVFSITHSDVSPLATQEI